MVMYYYWESGDFENSNILLTVEFLYIPIVVEIM